MEAIGARSSILYMFSGHDPLINGNSTHDLCHPLIRLTYVYEIQSKDIAMEILTLAAIHYESISRRFLDKSAPSSRDPSKAAKSPVRCPFPHPLGQSTRLIHQDTRPREIGAPLGKL